MRAASAASVNATVTPIDRGGGSLDVYELFRSRFDPSKAANIYEGKIIL
jgi:hypothetical protein